MVNTGKVSYACGTCKQRRIKCDLAKPACSQCTKSGWICPGPKNETKITFKDQTETVMQNARRGRLTTNKSMATASRSHVSLYSITRTVSPSTLDRGTAFFMHQYIFLGDRGSILSISRGHHEYLPALMRQERTNGPLRIIIAAAGLAALSNAGNARTWVAESYQLYNEAIRQLKSALSNPAEVCMDCSLAAMMLMGTFEAIASGDVDSMRYYGGHTMAAARCIDLRGPTQFNGNVSLKLFLELRRIIFMTCHQLQTTIPYAVDKWSKWAEPVQQPEELCSNRFAEINSQLAEIRAELKLCGITSTPTLTAKLLSVDEQLIHWKRDIPESWSYMACQVPDVGNTSPYIWQSRYDRYTDFWKATVWNSFRCVRLVVHEAIIKMIVAHEPTDHPDLLQASVTALREITDEVCSSVPYFLGYCSRDSQNIQADCLAYSLPPPIPGGYVLIWPLFLSAILRTTSRAQRDWIAGILRHVGLKMGLKLAISMATTLAENARTLSDGDSWLNGDFCPQI